MYKLEISKKMGVIDFDKKIWHSDSFKFYLLNENQKNKRLFDQEDVIQFCLKI